jgi:hypothetical protein
MGGRIMAIDVRSQMSPLRHGERALIHVAGRPSWGRHFSRVPNYLHSQCTVHIGSSTMCIVNALARANRRQCKFEFRGNPALQLLYKHEDLGLHKALHMPSVTISARWWRTAWQWRGRPPTSNSTHSFYPVTSAGHWSLLPGTCMRRRAARRRP